jgi:hypothetical protein
MTQDSDKVIDDYTWKVMRSGNPNKAWIVDMTARKKLSALMSVVSAERIAIAHNMAVKYLQDRAQP